MGKSLIDFSQTPPPGVCGFTPIDSPASRGEASAITTEVWQPLNRTVIRDGNKGISRDRNPFPTPATGG